MAGAEHLVGIQHDYKILNKVQGRCYYCGETSECEITRYQKSYHILSFPLKIIEEQFLFDWEKCGHRAILYEKRHVERYKEEQVKTGLLNVPYYLGMKPILTAKPKYYKPNLIIVIIICLIFAALIACIMAIFDIRYIY